MGIYCVFLGVNRFCRVFLFLFLFGDFQFLSWGFIGFCWVKWGFPIFELGFYEVSLLNVDFGGFYSAFLLGFRMV